MGRNRRIIAIVVIALLVVAVEAGALYKMVSMVMRGESPRQIQAHETHTAETVETSAPPAAEPDTSPAVSPTEPANPSEEPTNPPEEPTSSSETPGEQLLGAGDLGDYHIEIGDIEILRDTEGNPAVLITYTWTNNSPATASAMVMLLDRAIQGETQLPPTLLRYEGYDALSAAQNVSPGGTATVQRAFRLASGEEPLHFSVTEFLSHTNRAVVKDFDLSAAGS